VPTMMIVDRQVSAVAMRDHQQTTAAFSLAECAQLALGTVRAPLPNLQVAMTCMIPVVVMLIVDYRLIVNLALAAVLAYETIQASEVARSAQRPHHRLCLAWVAALAGHRHRHLASAVVRIANCQALVEVQ